MKSVIYQPVDTMLAWASERCAGVSFRQDARAIGMIDDDGISAVVVFDTFSPGDCCISVASDGSRRWLTREFLVHVFAYPFLQLGQRRLTALISDQNTDSVRFCTSCGFSREGTLRRGDVNGEDLHIYGLLREECRFLPVSMAGNAAPAAL